MDLVKSIKISAAGMKAQGLRLRVIAENLANAESLAQMPGGDPYRRKVVIFRNVLDRALGMRMVRVHRLAEQQGEFSTRFDPPNPAADAEGYVKLPNVNPLLEMTDMRQAQRSYEANLNVVKASKRMLLQTIDLLRR
jgi:flagellar basal-body rod protein FlgC